MAIGALRRSPRRLAGRLGGDIDACFLTQRAAALTRVVLFQR
jgi:hypothetical protein